MTYRVVDTTDHLHRGTVFTWNGGGFMLDSMLVEPITSVTNSDGTVTVSDYNYIVILMAV